MASTTRTWLRPETCLGPPHARIDNVNGPAGQGRQNDCLTYDGATPRVARAVYLNHLNRSARGRAPAIAGPPDLGLRWVASLPMEPRYRNRVQRGKGLSWGQRQDRLKGFVPCSLRTKISGQVQVRIVKGAVTLGANGFF